MVQKLLRVGGIMRFLSLRLRVMVIVLLVIFVWFVWPTPYRDLPCSTSAASYGDCSHINRITGAICRVSQTCWINPRMW